MVDGRGELCEQGEFAGFQVYTNIHIGEEAARGIYIPLLLGLLKESQRNVY